MCLYILPVAFSLSLCLHVSLAKTILSSQKNKIYIDEIRAALVQHIESFDEKKENEITQSAGLCVLFLFSFLLVVLDFDLC